MAGAMRAPAERRRRRVPAATASSGASGRTSTARRTSRCLRILEDETQRGRLDRRGHGDARPPRLRRQRRRGARLRRAARRATPRRRGQVTVLESDELALAQDTVKMVKAADVDHHLRCPGRLCRRHLVCAGAAQDAASCRCRLRARRDPPPDHSQRCRLATSSTRSRRASRLARRPSRLVDHRHQPALGRRVGARRLRSGHPGWAHCSLARPNQRAACAARSRRRSVTGRESPGERSPASTSSSSCGGRSPHCALGSEFSSSAAWSHWALPRSAAWP